MAPDALSRRRTALAIFARTPGLSLAKTRLAAGIGAEAAAEFGRLALDAVEAVVRAACMELPGLVPVWAVTEREGLGHPRWRGFPALWQGEGGLGARMAATYEALQAEHGAAILVGSDLPLLAPAHLVLAVRHLAEPATPYVLGPALDGGFYLFGGRAALPREAWEGVPYGTEGTAAAFRAAVGEYGPLAELEVLPDVDVAEDLPRLLAAAAGRPGLLPAQVALLDWARGVVR